MRCSIIEHTNLRYNAVNYTRKNVYDLTRSIDVDVQNVKKRDRVGNGERRVGKSRDCRPATA